MVEKHVDTTYLLCFTLVLPTLEMGVYAAVLGGQPQQGDSGQNCGTSPPSWKFGDVCSLKK